MLGSDSANMQQLRSVGQRDPQRGDVRRRVFAWFTPMQWNDVASLLLKLDLDDQRGVRIER